MVTDGIENLCIAFTMKRRILFHFVLIITHLLMTDAFQIPDKFSCTSYCGTGSMMNRSPLISRTEDHCNNRYRLPSLSWSRRTTKLFFMGSDNGLLGVGGPEIFTIILVGYFVLGPSDLYKLVKEIGKFLQNIRTLGTDLSTTFENNMESSLQLEELRKAQRELNDAFSFRRSINVDADSEAFSVQAGSAQKAEAMAAMASTAVAIDPNAPPKKIRRRIRKKVVPEIASSVPVNNIPDLDMPTTAMETAQLDSITDEEASIIEAEFNQYVTNPFDDWDSWSGGEKEKSVDSNTTIASTEMPPAMDQAARSRFQQQLSGSWNEQILSAGDKLEPMAIIMNKIALLEREKAAALKRLEDEFSKRTEVEEKYYKEQRQILEKAVSEVQSTAFGLDSKTIV